MKQLKTAGLVVIQNGKLLLALSRNKNAWYLPGGKTDEGETSVAALIRELREELNISISPKDLVFYTHITAPAFGEMQDLVMEQDCFLHELYTNPLPGAEIRELKYFSRRDYIREVQVPGVVLLMEKLIADKLMD
jgi:8-oxo-dGTP pyrophosphatase MutT (NUDIX family)